MAKFSQLTEITDITDSDLMMITDAETSASKKITWANVKSSIDSLDNTGDIVVSGDLIQTPSTTMTPTSNGQLVVEATNDTTLTFKYKGSDGVVRSGTISLS